MSVDERADVRRQGLPVDRQISFVQQLTRPRPDQMQAQYRAAAAATTFTRPSVSPTIIARPFPANECLCTSTSCPASRASASVIPAQATSGCV